MTCFCSCAMQQQSRRWSPFMCSSDALAWLKSQALCRMLPDDCEDKNFPILASLLFLHSWLQFYLVLVDKIIAYLSR